MPRTAATTAPRAGHDRRWIALVLLAAAEFIVVLDASIVNIALPDIGRGLHIRNGDLAWIITAYVIAFGGLLPLGGRLADLLGRRRMFIAGVALFTASSLAGGLAPTGAVLIGARVVQGVGAAMLAPAALALVTTIFREGADRAKALGIWGAVAAGGGAAGVLLGGLLTGAFGWRSVFLINIPIGTAVIALTRSLVAESDGRGGRGLSLARFDLPGAATVTTGLFALVTALSRGPVWGWGSPATVALLAVSTALLAAFILIERRARFALVPLRLFTVRTVSAGNAIMLLVGAGMLGFFYFLSLYEQFVLGYGPVAAGLSQLPMAIALIVGAGLAAPLMARAGARQVLTGGLVLFAAGLAWFAVAPTDGTFLIGVLGPSVLVGLGLGAAFVPVTALAVAGVPAGDAGVAGGLVNISQQVGGAIGLAALAALALSRTQDAARHGAPVLDATNTGYRWAFGAAAAVALIAAVTAAIVVHRRDADASAASDPSDDAVPDARLARAA